MRGCIVKCGDLIKPKDKLHENELYWGNAGIVWVMDCDDVQEI